MIAWRIRAYRGTRIVLPWLWIAMASLPLQKLSAGPVTGSHFDVAAKGEWPVDLARKPWKMARGFDPRWIASGPTPDAPDVRTVGGPPLLPAKVFHTPPGDGIVEFTISTEFVLALHPNDLPVPALQIPWLGENWEIFLNGHMVRREIHLDPSGHRMVRVRTFRGITIPIEKAWLHPGSNSLVIHLLGNPPSTRFTTNDSLGVLFSDGFGIDSISKLENDPSKPFDIALIAVFLFFGFYHILIYFLERKVYYVLYFGLFAICVALDGITKNPFLFPYVSDMAGLFRVKFLVQTPLFPMMFLFLHDYFRTEERVPLLYRAVVVISSLFALAILLIPYRYMDLILFLMHFYTLPLLPIAIFIILREVVGHKRDALAILITFTITALTGIWDILDDLFFKTGVRLIRPGFFTFLLVTAGIIAHRFIRFLHESERLNHILERQKDSFVRFVPTQFLQLLERSSAEEITLGENSLQTMSVLMADLRSFTTLAEGMSPEETFRFLNSWLAHMAPSIMSEGGFIDKYMGDAILALFSEKAPPESRANFNMIPAPESRQARSCAERALMAALGMRRELAIYNGHRKKSGYRPVDFGIGIHTGPLVLGTVGAAGRMDTTVVGNTVNLAARLEKLNRMYGTQILITEQTRLRLASPEQYRIRWIDTVAVRGSHKPVVVHEVYDLDPPARIRRKQRTAPLLREALLAIANENYAGAGKFLEEAHRLDPRDPVILHHRERLGQLRKGFVQSTKPA